MAKQKIKKAKAGDPAVIIEQTHKGKTTVFFIELATYKQQDRIAEELRKSTFWISHRP